MKYGIFTLAFLLLLLPSIACATVYRTEDDGSTILIDVDERFTVSLPTNNSAGYDWTPEYNGSVLELVSESFVVGGDVDGGVTNFVFKGLVDGEIQIIFTYSGPIYAGYSLIVVVGDGDAYLPVPSFTVIPALVCIGCIGLMGCRRIKDGNE